MNKKFLIISLCLLLNLTFTSVEFAYSSGSDSDREWKFFPKQIKEYKAAGKHYHPDYLQYTMSYSASGGKFPITLTRLFSKEYFNKSLQGMKSRIYDFKTSNINGHTVYLYKFNATRKGGARTYVGKYTISVSGLPMSNYREYVRDSFSYIISRVGGIKTSKTTRPIEREIRKRKIRAQKPSAGVSSRPSRKVPPMVKKKPLTPAMKSAQYMKVTHNWPRDNVLASGRLKERQFYKFDLYIKTPNLDVSYLIDAGNVGEYLWLCITTEGTIIRDGIISEKNQKKWIRFRPGRYDYYTGSWRNHWVTFYIKPTNCGKWLGVDAKSVNVLIKVDPGYDCVIGYRNKKGLLEFVK